MRRAEVFVALGPLAACLEGTTDEKSQSCRGRGRGRTARSAWSSGLGAGGRASAVHDQRADHLGANGPVAETFTATGPLCPSGTFVDTVLATQPDNSQGPDHGKLILIVRSVYTCSDGSGTFNAQKEIVGTLGPGGTSTGTGQIQLLGGTGAFTNLIGHGVDIGSINGNTATATDSGVIVRI
jgi:hypothetical protein